MLTAAQLEARRGKLTASRVGCLMRSDHQAMMQLYREMIGEVTEEFTMTWAMEVGEATEPKQLNRFEHLNSPVTRRGEVVVHPWHDWAACTLDGWVEELACPIECKHVGGREPIEVVIQRYQPQLHFQMECCEATQCIIAIARCLDDPVYEKIERDGVYADELMRRAMLFIESVRRRTPPVILPPAPPPVSKWRDYDMAGNDTWRLYAREWLQVRGAAETEQKCAKVLKSLVPDDASKCFGEGVRITRDRAGRLSLRVDA